VIGQSPALKTSLWPKTFIDRGIAVAFTTLVLTQARFPRQGKFIQNERILNDHLS
jgi:hypothetical protein